MKRDSLTSRIRTLIAAPVLAVVLAAGAAPADAAFPGTPGPIAYSQSFANALETGGGIFAHPPRRNQRARRLTSFTADESPSYSADGRSIVFAADHDYRDPLGTRIYLMGSAGSNVRAITDGSGFDSNPAFSPDGRRVVFDRRIGAGPPHIFVVNVDGSGLRQLTLGTSADYEPTFTPSGRRIVFVSNRRDDDDHDRTAIYAIGPDGSSPRVLINTPRNEGEPDVSPNGKRIVFMSTRDGGQNIYIAASNGRHMRPLLKPVSTCSHRSCYSNPVWSPDEKHIAALKTSTYSSSIEVLRVDGRGYGKTFADAGTEEEGYGTYIGPPAWGPAPR